MNSLSLEPAIDIIMAPMLTGKTTEVVRRLVIYHEMGMKVLYVNSNKDTRSKDAFSTHNCTLTSIPFDAIKVSDLTTLDVEKYEVIAIDEASFFSNLKETVLRWVEKQNKIVIVAGLNGDFQRQPFGEINDLVPYCDSITKLTAFCVNCKNTKNVIRPAHFTKRTVKSDEKVLVGGKELYIPVCRKCFIEL